MDGYWGEGVDIDEEWCCYERMNKMVEKYCDMNSVKYIVDM